MEEESLGISPRTPHCDSRSPYCLHSLKSLRSWQTCQFPGHRLHLLLLFNEARIGPGVLVCYNQCLTKDTNPDTNSVVSEHRLTVSLFFPLLLPLTPNENVRSWSE